MNMYGLVTLFALFINADTFNTLMYTNKATNRFELFMKKSKKSDSYLYRPKSYNQESYFNYLNDESNKIIISIGPAGCGKTLFGCQKAITQMKSQEIDKIIITRPVVTVEEEIGFLPGNLVKKMDPWTKPIFDIFQEYYSKSELDLLIYSGKIEICPLAFMRGRTFKNAFIIADEMQNSSPNQMKMLVTRLGINSRMVITGDLEQTDIPRENGLHDFISRIENYNNTELIKLIKLGKDDIERSDIVKTVINIYDYKKETSVLVKPNGDTTKEINNIVAATNLNNTDSYVVDSKQMASNTTITKSTIYNTINNNTTSINSSYNKNEDAALIPKRLISRNFDIFFGSTDF